MKEIYFDNNATTPLRAEVLEAMLPYYKDVYGNPSSIHGIGQRAKKSLEDAREKIAELLNAKSPSEVIFTSSGTESNNTAIKGVAFANKSRGNHIITSAIEHHAVLNPCEYLANHHGFEITYLPVDKYGRISPDDLSAAIKSTTVLVSIMHANNEIGTVQPVEEIGKMLKRINARRAGNRIYFHTDAVQTVGKLPIDVAKMNVDLLSFSAHKFYGPKGAGGLYVKEGVIFHPLLHGGHHEGGRRAATENVAGIVGMARAMELAIDEMPSETDNLLRLRKKLEKGILGKIPNTHLNGHPTERLPGTTNVSFEFIEGESLVVLLDMSGIAASTGSACASGSSEPSHVITAIGCPPNLSQGSVRFSLGRYNTEKEVDYLLKILPSAIEKLRKISPLYNK